MSLKPSCLGVLWIWETNRIQQQGVCFVETCTRGFIYSERTQVYMYSMSDCYTVLTHLPWIRDIFREAVHLEAEKKNPFFTNKSFSTQCNFTKFSTLIVSSVLWCCWLGSRKGIQPVKNWVVGCWCGYLSGARCRLSHGPADVTATHCLLLQ